MKNVGLLKNYSAELRLLYLGLFLKSRNILVFDIFIFFASLRPLLGITLDIKPYHPNQKQLQFPE